MLESKRKAIIFLVLSFLLAIAAGLFFLQKVREINSELGGMVEIYVAATDIPSRTEIQANQVKTEEIPKRFLKEKQHVTDLENLIDKVLVVPLSEGNIITENMIKPVSEARNENNRLVTMYQSERLQFDQIPESLDRIDIIVSSRLESSAPKTEVFMKDVLVAGILEKDGEFAGVVVEIPAGDAPAFIHMQNYSDTIRVLKANVGKEEMQEENKETVIENVSNEEVTEQPENNVEQTQTNSESSVDEGTNGN